MTSPNAGTSYGLVIDGRWWPTVSGAAVIGRRPVGTVRVPLVTLPWRDDQAVTT